MAEVVPPICCDNVCCKIEEIDNGKKVFLVKIVETYERVVPIKAVDGQEAYRIAEDQVNTGEIDLPCDGDDYDYNVEFFVKEGENFLKNNQ